MCELISALLASEGAQLRFAALLLVHDLMCKAGEDWLSLFTREGIVFMVQKLSSSKGKVGAGKREEVRGPLSLASWAARSGASTAGHKGNSLQEVTEPTLAAMLDFVCDKFFPAGNSDGEDSDEATPVVRELRRLGTAMVKSGEKGDEKAALASLAAVMGHFESSATVSTFEMQNSGVCENLMVFLARKGSPSGKGKAGGKGGGSKSTTPTKQKVRPFPQAAVERTRHT